MVVLALAVATIAFYSTGYYELAILCGFLTGVAYNEV